MQSGYIGLAVNNNAEERLRYFRYRNRKQRRGVVEKWKKFYGEGFEKLYIFIYPDVNEDSYNRLTGLNMRFRKEKNKHPRESETIVSSNKRIIQAFKRSGELVGTFQRLEQASEKTGVSKPHISYSARGGGIPAKDYYFKYIN